MKLYIVRHGIALDVGQDGVKRDADRPLSPQGRRRTRRVAEGLSAMGCRPDRMGTSPLPRAEETARILAEVLCPEVRVETCDFLSPGAASRDLLNWLVRGGGEEVMIVGHAPDVECLAAELLTEGDLGMAFKKAAACCVSFRSPAAGQATLEWLIPPKALRLMAGR